MKKILMILDNAFKPDLRVKKEIETLTKLGLNIYLYCWDKDSELPEYVEEDLLKIKRVKVKSKSQLGLGQIKNLFKFYIFLMKTINKEKQKFGYIHVHDFLMLPLGVILKLKLKIPLIYDAHEIYHLMEWEKYNPFVSNVIFFTERFLINFIDYFIVVNQLRKDFYKKYYKKEIIILGNWYDPFIGNEVNIKEDLKIPTEDLVFGYFGALSRESRCLDFIINSILEIPNAHLLIAGNGFDSDFAASMSLKYERIHYLGWIEEIRKYFNNLDYLVYFMNEGQKYFFYAAPNTLYLALSHKIPLITNVPGEPEFLVKNFNIGFFIEKDEKIKDKIEVNIESDLYKEKVNNIIKINNKYTWSISFDIFSKIYQTKNILELKEN